MPAWKSEGEREGTKQWSISVLARNEHRKDMPGRFLATPGYSGRLIFVSAQKVRGLRTISSVVAENTQHCF